MSLCIGVIDLSSEKYNIPKSNYKFLLVCIFWFFFLYELATVKYSGVASGCVTGAVLAAKSGP